MSREKQTTDEYDDDDKLLFHMNANIELYMMQMFHGKFDYTCEYQGNAPRLVHTPLNRLEKSVLSAVSMPIQVIQVSNRSSDQDRFRDPQVPGSILT